MREVVSDLPFTACALLDHEPRNYLLDVNKNNRY